MRSKLVKEAIMSRGLSVRQFAQSIGIPASTLQSAIEQDDGYVDFITYYGYEKHELVKEILILELISLTVLFAGISFIMCKKSHPH